jgi:hypothetical protein
MLSNSVMQSQSICNSFPQYAVHIANFSEALPVLKLHAMKVYRTNRMEHRAWAEFHDSQSGRESHGIRNEERLCWRRLAAINKGQSQKIEFCTFPVSAFNGCDGKLHNPAALTHLSHWAGRWADQIWTLINPGRPSWNWLEHFRFTLTQTTYTPSRLTEVCEKPQMPRGQTNRNSFLVPLILTANGSWAPEGVGSRHLPHPLDILKKLKL